MKWTSLLLLSAVAVVVPGDAWAIKPTGDSIPSTLSLKPNNNLLASAAASPSSKTDSKASAELQILEKRFFRHDFTSEPISERLTRMEKFTFGEVSKGTDQQRLAKLTAVLETHDADTPLSSIDTKPRKVAAATPPQSAAQPDSNSDSSDASDNSDGSDYPHITYLEDEILGQHYGGSLESRLSRLETKAFGSASKNPDMSSRTDTLERYAEVKLHKKAFDQHPADDAVPGPQRFPGLGGFRMGMGGMPMNAMGMNPMGAGGMFPDDDRPSAPPPPKVVDPAAFLPTPPPEGARLLSRVAWCEQHIFNKTYPELHLLERLHQLNANLNPSDKEKDIQLMDHVDTIVKEVVMRQHPPNANQSI